MRVVEVDASARASRVVDAKASVSDSNDYKLIDFATYVAHVLTAMLFFVGKRLQEAQFVLDFRIMSCVSRFCTCGYARDAHCPYFA